MMRTLTTCDDPALMSHLDEKKTARRRRDVIDPSVHSTDTGSPRSREIGVIITATGVQRDV